MTAPTRVALRYEVPRTRPDWTLPEEPAAESKTHDLTIDLLKALLLAWLARTDRNAEVARNLAIRWDEEHPQIGFDPDLCLIEPPTPDGDELESLCTWEPGHVAPRLAIEVVSKSNAIKDYASTPEKCAAAGVEELIVFDPKLVGPRRGIGRVKLQVWRRGADAFERVYTGEGPAYSTVLDAWLFVVDEGRRVRVANDRDGTRWWETGQEAERREKEAERREKEAERRDKEAALARIAELEARLAGR